MFYNTALLNAKKAYIQAAIAFLKTKPQSIDISKAAEEIKTFNQRGSLYTYPRCFQTVGMDSPVFKAEQHLRQLDKKAANVYVGLGAALLLLITAGWVASAAFAPAVAFFLIGAVYLGAMLGSMLYVVKARSEARDKELFEWTHEIVDEAMDVTELNQALSA